MLWDALKERSSLKCGISYNKRHFCMEILKQFSQMTCSLMTLYISESAQNWEAVDSSFSEVGRKHYYINVCHKVLKRGGAFSCSDGAAVCSVGESGVFAGGVFGGFFGSLFF